MENDNEVDIRLAHGYFSKFCFNAAWDLIEKSDRIPAETDMMIHLAHASVYHWSRRTDCTDQNLSIGYWQLSRAYALANQGACAKHFAQVCLSYSQQHGVARIYLGYAYEALTRASAVAGEDEDAHAYYHKAQEIAAGLAEGDREQLLADLAGII